MHTSYSRMTGMSEDALPQVKIYTDGSCRPNPGPGGWAAILLFQDREPLEITGSSPGQTTNNRMELRAALGALQSLDEPHRVILHTDSQYLRRGITEWLPLWEKRNWQTMDSSPVKNRDLWHRLLVQQGLHAIHWQWVRGHDGDRWNERADLLASAAVPSPPLPLEDREAIHLFTAASYRPSVKKGAWTVLLRYRDRIKVLQGESGQTSANRLHLEATLAGLESIRKPLPIHLYTTSGYLRDGACGWLANWVAADWQTRDGVDISHRELWQKMHRLSRSLDITYHLIPSKDRPCDGQAAKIIASQAAAGSPQ